LLEIRKQIKAEKDPKLMKKKYTKQALARHAFNLENYLDGPASTLTSATALVGGVVSIDDVEDNSLWSIPEPSQDAKGKRKGKDRFIHAVSGFERVEMVIGYSAEAFQKSPSIAEPKQLFAEPVTKRAKKSKNPRSKVTPTRKIIPEPTNRKIQRLIAKSGFAKDNLKEIGQLVKLSQTPILTGDLNKLGTLMLKQQNLLSILGVYPQSLKNIAAAAEKNSYGVSIIGSNADCILALPKDPQKVTANIEGEGGIAVLVKSSNSRVVSK
jgi:mevalonate kinase